MRKELKFKDLSSYLGDAKDYIDANATVLRKSMSDTEITSTGTSITAIFSTANVDRDGDLVWPGGCINDYYNGAVCWMHKMSELPIGVCTDLRISKDAVSGTIDLAKDYDFAEQVGNLIRQKMLKGISIGFIPKEILRAGTPAFAAFASANGLNISGCNQIITKWELLEVSICTVGVNKSAIIQSVASKAIELDHELQDDLGIDTGYAEAFATMMSLVKSLSDTVDNLKHMQTKAVEDEKPVEDVADAQEPKPALEVEVEVDPIDDQKPVEDAQEPEAVEDKACDKDKKKSVADIDWSTVKAVVVKHVVADTAIKQKALYLSRGKLI